MRRLLHKVWKLGMVVTCCLVSVSSAMAQTLDRSTQKATTDSIDHVNQPENIEEYLNQISNPDIPRDVRKKWKEQALQLFAHEKVPVLAEKNGLGNRYTAAALLDLLVDFPHRIKTKEILRDQQDKITELHLELNRQTK